MSDGSVSPGFSTVTISTAIASLELADDRTCWEDGEGAGAVDALSKDAGIVARGAENRE
jgi:hypothetical protein